MPADELDDTAKPTTPLSISDLQHWTRVIGQAQQMMLEYGFKATEQDSQQTSDILTANPFLTAQKGFWQDSVALWQKFLTPAAAPRQDSFVTSDKRFAAPQWRDNPAYDLIHQSYLFLSDHMLKSVDGMSGLDAKVHDQMRFAARNFVEALSPANFPLTNPVVLEKTLATGGENLLNGLKHMLADAERGQLSHTNDREFELGRNIATTPGKVIYETPLYQLIQYEPTTERVLKTPLIIFPPWINRFYILDLNPEKSFVRWAVAQGLTVFMVSWKSADASMADVSLDGYIINGQLDAIEVVRRLLDVKSVHAVGYCVAGTTLAATLALLAARGEEKKVKSATFFTAQVDFSLAGELHALVDDNYLALIDSVVTDGYLDGRYLAMTFNLLRARDLIWSYVVNNYLLGADYPPFDLLYWNGDTTNLPARWHRSYLVDFYRDNLLVVPGALKVGGTSIDLTRIKTAAYVQAGREDHIAPAASVWKITDHFKGPLRFVLAGSGHIAGVVNPPAANKYQYWHYDKPAASFNDFIANANEVKGSWWPDWINWIRKQGSVEVQAAGARQAGKGIYPVIEEAPGRYVKTR